MDVCLVFDIGKTNKKAFVFSQKYEVLWQETVQISEILDDDGEHCDDLMAIVSWLKKTYEKINANPIYAVKAINFSTYGASLVYVDKNGSALTPIYNYLKVFPKDLKASFIEKYNVDGTFFLKSASPDMGMLNSGLQAYWLKYKKLEYFKNARFALHFPQYLSYLFTKKAQADFSSLGSHTGIWDFEKKQYMTWLEQEHLHMLSLEPQPASQVENLNGQQVGIGMHDSSAALVPYLKCIKVPFVLISTGTWSVSMNPFNAEALTSKELENDCLQYLTFEGKPVKSSRIFSGNEHERHTQHLANYFEKPLEYYKTVVFDAGIVKMLRKKNIQIMPREAHLEVLMESQFVERNLNAFTTYEEAYHQLIMDLVTQQVASTSLVLNDNSVRKIIVEGGFSKNTIFMKLLTEAFFHQKIFKANLAQGSALGAAMVIAEAWGAKEAELEDLNLVEII
jgi:L-fuculokinase